MVLSILLYKIHNVSVCEWLDSTFCGDVYYSLQGGSNFWTTQKLTSDTFLWRATVYNVPAQIKVILVCVCCRWMEFLNVTRIQMKLQRRFPIYVLFVDHVWVWKWLKFNSRIEISFASAKTVKRQQKLRKISAMIVENVVKHDYVNSY